jgi:hypothetical protein
MMTGKKGKKKRTSNAGSIKSVQPPTEQLVGAQPSHGAIEIEIAARDLWGLVTPPVEYHADNCAFNVINGGPTIYFCQYGPNMNILNTIALSFTRMAFVSAMKVLGSIRSNVEESAKTIYESASIAPLDMDILDKSITNENYKKFPAQILRAASTGDTACIDFYNLAPLIQRPGQPATKQNVMNNITACIRVYLTPLLLLHLMNIARLEEAVPNER